MSLNREGEEGIWENEKDNQSGVTYTSLLAEARLLKMCCWSFPNKSHVNLTLWQNLFP